MASDEVLDFASLLAPIPGDNPAGEDIRADYSPTSVYWKIKDARSTARNIERKAIEDPELMVDARPDWSPVLELAPEVLTQKSKDLEVTAWLIEALVRKHGFPGLRDGFRLARELIENFWDHLYPRPDEEDGVRARVAALVGLNGEDAEGTLIGPIANIPITQRGSQEAYAAWHYEQAAALETLDDPDHRAQRIEQGAVTLQAFERGVAESSPEFFQDLIQDIEAAQAEFDKLTELLDEKCGSELAPPSSNIRNALARSREIVGNVTRHLFGAEDESGEAAGEGGGEAAAGGAGGRKIAAREDAFRTLLQVAEFFRRTEPHAPISYLLEQAVRWGKMPLPELLTELIPDEMAREHLFKLVGIKPPETPE